MIKLEDCALVDGKYYSWNAQEETIVEVGFKFVKPEKITDEIRKAVMMKHYGLTEGVKK